MESSRRSLGGIVLAAFVLAVFPGCGGGGGGGDDGGRIRASQMGGLLSFDGGVNTVFSGEFRVDDDEYRVVCHFPMAEAPDDGRDVMLVIPFELLIAGTMPTLGVYAFFADGSVSVDEFDNGSFTDDGEFPAAAHAGVASFNVTSRVHQATLADVDFLAFNIRAGGGARFGLADDVGLDSPTLEFED